MKRNVMIYGLLPALNADTGENVCSTVKLKLAFSNANDSCNINCGSLHFLPEGTK